ncbi:MAG: M36 family metallopeptidase [Saprospiraceae bacterium]|nr:M36 family metallopeptidase [Saprospiraceae bacterium]
MRFLLILFLISSGFSTVREDTAVIKFLQDQSESLGLLAEDVAGLTISSSHREDKSGLKYFYIQQNYEGYPIEHALAIVVQAKDGDLEIINHSLLTGIKNRLNLPAIQAPEPILRLARKHLSQDTDEAEFRVHQLIWIMTGETWTLSYVIRIDRHDLHWRVWVAAENGRMLRKRDLFKECTFSGRDHLHTQNHSNGTDVHFTGTTMEGYLVYPWPVESPQHGERQWVISPSDMLASPFGWHDQDGIEGPDFTDTRGNNVFAQDDQDGLDISEDRPDGGNSLNFNYSLDLGQNPSVSIDATVTNLFYWNNLNHDIFYHYGFDEAAGNFQINNYSRGGLGRDQVYADAQDGSDLNNARFFVAEDGSPGRMQMYLWRPQLYDASITLRSPDSSATVIDAVESGFSPNNKLEDSALPAISEILLIDDAGGTHLACLDMALLNADSVAGKIALVDRGECFFIEKVKRLQELGALAVIVGNNITDSPFAMGGADPEITIPAFMISLDQANRLKFLLSQGKLEVSLDGRKQNVLFDSALDNLIITHEYGHGISTRLVAGSQNIDCLDNSEQMGEGWSDYFGLMLTTDWTTAHGDDIRGIGTYVSAEAPLGTGLRQYPYSTDLTINPMHYDNVKDSPLTHDVGAIWCAMLWDMTWNIIDRVGTSTDLYRGQGGNNIALQLVMTGLKLTPCNPGFVDGRDAILKADSMLYGGKYQYQIWKAFARRGLGFSADQGSALFTFDGQSDSDLPGIFQTQVDFFDAVEKTESINIEITTLQEYDNEAFIIQRSTDKVLFETITTFPGEIYLPDSRSLNYEDRNVVPGQLYFYRLLSRHTDRGDQIIAQDSAILIPVTDMLIYPNPNTGRAALKIDDTITGLTRVSILSIEGKLIQSKEVDAAALHVSHNLDLEYLSAGVYMVEVRANDDVFRRKFIKR